MPVISFVIARRSARGPDSARPRISSIRSSSSVISEPPRRSVRCRLIASRCSVSASYSRNVSGAICRATAWISGGASVGTAGAAAVGSAVLWRIASACASNSAKPARARGVVCCSGYPFHAASPPGPITLNDRASGKCTPTPPGMPKNASGTAANSRPSLGAPTSAPACATVACAPPKSAEPACITVLSAVAAGRISASLKLLTSDVRPFS